MYHTLFIHSPTERYRGYFQVLVIMIRMQGFMWTKVLNFFG